MIMVDVGQKYLLELPDFGAYIDDGDLVAFLVRPSDDRQRCFRLKRICVR